MRILLFHGAIDPLNHFTDHAKEFLEKIGCEIFVCTLPPTKQETVALGKFFQRGIHAVFMYDGIGMCFKEIYDCLKIPVVNILADHPMTFRHCMEAPPQKYIQFSPDEKHVEFVRKYWNIRQSFFLPHMGTAPIVKDGNRPIALLFSGTCWPFDRLMDTIRQADECYGGGGIFFDMIDYMLMDHHITIEEACSIVLKDKNIALSSKEFTEVLIYAKAVDEYVRMYYRDRAVRTILEAGMDITVIGVNWDKSDLMNYPNFHWIGSMPFGDVFQYMSKSKVVLNVMPWFKAGSHERIFNTLLSGACPISDKSQWLEREFINKKEIIYYNLDKIEDLPEKIATLLKDDDLREEIVRRGQEKVIRKYSTANVIGEALQRVIDIYYPEI